MSRKTPRDSGFSLTEAIVALLVLSLAMSQLPNLMSLFSGAYRETVESVRLAKDSLASSRELSRTSQSTYSVDTAPADGPLSIGSLQYHHPCQFDVVGRRCL
jgi:prepilin-type N-terminal cleavage/methylation domain-containing protein